MNGWKYPPLNMTHMHHLRYHPILDEYQFRVKADIYDFCYTAKLTDFLNRYEDCQLYIGDNYGDPIIVVEGWCPMTKEEFLSFFDKDGLERLGDGIKTL